MKLAQGSKVKDVLEVHLRPLVIGDLARILDWSRDEAFCLANGWPVGLSAEQLQDWFVLYLNNPPVGLVRRGILLVEQLVGFVDLRDLSPLEQRARLRIAIGEETHRGQGVGYAAGLKMLEHGFVELGLWRITAEIHGSNIRMRNLVEELGFAQEGVLRQHETRLGIREDLYLYGMLRPEFRLRPEASEEEYTPL